MRRTNRLVFLSLAGVATLAGVLQGALLGVWLPACVGFVGLLAGAAAYFHFLRRARRWRRGQQLHWTRLLHASNAWHCGCPPCSVARASIHGDVRRTIIPGPWPIRVESWVPTKSEWRRLRGRE